MNILSTATQEHQAVLVDETNAGEYKEPVPINAFYKPLSMVMFQKSRLKQLNVVFVHAMNPSEAQKRSHLDVGVFSAKFAGWTLTLNWTEEQRDKLPPDYIGVDYGNVSCGIIGPNVIRTCWNCGLTGWRDPEHDQ